MFILSPAAIKAITDDPLLRAKLIVALKVSESSLYRFYSNNEPNNDLTKYAALEVIREETGLADKKIVERIKSPASSSKITT